MSNDVPARVKKHSNGKGAKYTRSRLPVELVWLSHELDNRGHALTVELVIKRLPRVSKLLLIGNRTQLSGYLENTLKK